MPKQASGFLARGVPALLLCVFLCAACGNPAGGGSGDGDDGDTNYTNTWVQFNNRAQFAVTVYRDSTRRQVLAAVPAGGSAKAGASPAPTGTAFYPTYHFEIFNIPGIGIPYNGEGIVSLVYEGQINEVRIPAVESAETGSAYLRLENASDFSLSLNSGNVERIPLGGDAGIILSGKSAAYEITPGPVSAYTIKRNTTTALPFPAGLNEFEQGLLYLFRYEGNALTLTETKSALAAIPPAMPENVRAETVSGSGIQISWDAVNRASGYYVYRSGSETGSYNKVHTSLITGTSYTDTGLAENTVYYYRVCAVTSEGIEGSPSDTAAAATIAAPGSLEASAVSSTSIKLSWDAADGASGYNVYRSTGANGTYGKANANMITAAAWTDTGLAANTVYYYKVGVVISGGIEGLRSSSFNARTLLAAPGDVRVTGVSANSVSLAWDTVGGANGYNVYRSTSEAGTYDKLNANVITAASYTDTGLDASITYYYKVSAVSGGAEGDRSKALPTTTTLLPAPGNLSSSAVSYNSVSLLWDTVSGAASYNLYRSTNKTENYSKVNAVALTAASYTNTGLDASAAYYYKVGAITAGGVDGERSGAFSITTAMLPAPGSPQASAVSANSVSLSWNAVSGAGGYNVYRSTSSTGTYSKVNAAVLTAASYTNTGLTANTAYYYKVSAVSNGGIEGVLSNAFSATTLLAAPGSLRTSAVSSSSISLAWDTVSGAGGYNLYRSTSSTGTYSKVNTSVLTAAAYTDTGLAGNTSYYYKARAVSGSVEGDWSGVMNAVTLLPAPGSLRVTAASANSISLAWDAASGASGYNVYRSTSSTGTYGKVNAATVSGTVWTNDTGLTEFTTYYYKVSAVSGGGSEGEKTSALSANTGVIAQGGTLAAKLTWLQTNAASNTLYLVEVNADESIGPQALSYSGKTNISIILRGSGTNRTVSLSASGALFTISNGVTLSLDNNITLKGRDDNNNAVVRMNSGVLFMNEGVKITGNTSSSSTSGGVYIASNATFTMNGGEISGTATTASVGGGGVYVNGGIFTLNSGKISGNTTSSSGVVYVATGTFTMNGGEISGNNTVSTGGGVYVLQGGGTFLMNGGKISGNTASHGGGVFVGNGTFTMNGGEISGNTAFSGGGVYDYSIFTMNGGKISGNTASSFGGGVVVFNIMTLTGGEISGNTASFSSGGGVYVGSGSSTLFRMSGGVIYGSNAAAGLKNTASSSGAALYCLSSPTAQYGTFSGSTFTKKGDLVTSNDTVRVVNGVLSSN